ncbi:unnamed protein product [Rotaria sp. Silwood1]|nr:unnamed protein product [Rotaria sp. Silwood1]CAF0963438.1 unnamed protein product [Rotaria sp. Silwood1]CAF3376371.1 unnamed protein product [Rotaria sp. Silwood1]CAF3380721.1 unnamed protein product [Rotaria sp. Silwood1]CAF4574660.1 unnamed protein product [Rotaria sp. Silwood1]
MNSSFWSYSIPPFYPSTATTTTPSNFYSCPYISSPYNPNMIMNSSIQTSLNSSSGYESATNETSFVDPCCSSSSCVMKESNSNSMYQESEHMNDEDTESSMSSTMNEKNYIGRKKRRVLSRPQRQEANRRERHRMEIINQAYEELRNVLPYKKGRKRQKMSRMDTVDGAIRYIHSLLETLHGPNYNPDWAKE